jgi:DNA-binding FrmR family transcriptional regulator
MHHAPSPLMGKGNIHLCFSLSSGVTNSMSHSPADPDADRRALQIRLRKITGQLKGVATMIEGDYDCAEVLNQLVSARQAVKSLAEKIIADHLEHCLTANSTADQRRRQLKEVTIMLKRYVE